MDIKALSDEQLIKIIREKDQELYKEIIIRYKEKLHNYLFRFSSSHDEIEDILQNVFIKTFKNLYGFKVEKKFSSWIYRIAHNEAINYIKKYSREKYGLDDTIKNIVDENEYLDDGMDRKLLRKEMEKYLKKLKIKYREPLYLFYFEEKSYEEISDILRIPINTVGTLISRGKKLLRIYIKSNIKQKNYG